MSNSYLLAEMLPGPPQTSTMEGFATTADDESNLSHELMLTTTCSKLTIETLK